MITRKEIVEALVAEYGPKVGPRNPDWDIDQPDSAENAYHLPPPPPEEVAKQEGAWVTFKDHDGFSSMRPATLEEIADVIVKLTSPPKRSILGPNENLGEEGLPHRYSASCTHCVFWVMADTEAAAVSTYESHSCAEVNARAPE